MCQRERNQKKRKANSIEAGISNNDNKRQKKNEPCCFIYFSQFCIFGWIRSDLTLAIAIIILRFHMFICLTFTRKYELNIDIFIRKAYGSIWRRLWMPGAARTADMRIALPPDSCQHRPHAHCKEGISSRGPRRDQ